MGEVGLPRRTTNQQRRHPQLPSVLSFGLRKTNSRRTFAAKMSDGEVEVEAPQGYPVLPKDVSQEIGATKLFNKWSYEDVEIRDISLTDYIQIRQPVYLPHSAGRFAQKRFRKAQCPIIERLTNSLMMNGRNNGKKLMAVRIVAHAFEIIHIMTVAECLAEELINAAKGSSNSYAIKKKDELERVAKSNRQMNVLNQCLNKRRRKKP